MKRVKDSGCNILRWNILWIRWLIAVHSSHFEKGALFPSSGGNVHIARVSVVLYINRFHVTNSTCRLHETNVRDPVFVNSSLRIQLRDFHRSYSLTGENGKRKNQIGKKSEIRETLSLARIMNKMSGWRQIFPRVYFFKHENVVCCNKLYLKI